MDMICQIMITVLGVPAIFLLARDNKYGWLCGLLSQPFWFYTSYVNEQWGVFLLSFAYGFNWVYGFYRHFLKSGSREFN
jgi:hypothetical protein